MSVHRYERQSGDQTLRFSVPQASSLPEAVSNHLSLFLLFLRTSTAGSVRSSRTAGFPNHTCRKHCTIIVFNNIPQLDGGEQGHAWCESIDMFAHEVEKACALRHGLRDEPQLRTATKQIAVTRATSATEPLAVPCQFWNRAKSHSEQLAQDNLATPSVELFLSSGKELLNGATARRATSQKRHLVTLDHEATLETAHSILEPCHINFRTTRKQYSAPSNDFPSRNKKKHRNSTHKLLNNSATPTAQTTFLNDICKNKKHMPGTT